ncbi:MAG: hypothetical protein MUE46_16660 [Xanthomonadales bacterium]|jgi:hypothetical protein|nr:hypothetical protein [Xanthomonadales bacterium]
MPHTAAPLEAWQAALAALGPAHFLLALGELLLLALALLAVRAAAEAGRATRGWKLLAALYGLLALDAVLQLHVPWVQLMRHAWLQAGHYEARRSAQVVVLGLGLVLALGGIAGLQARLRADWPALAPLLAGTALLLGVTALRWLSFHATDQLLSWRLAGVSLGRGLELLGLLLAAGALLHWLRRH